MANQKQEIESINITELGFVQVRVADIVEENGEELSRTIHMNVFKPGQDVSDQDQQIQNICQIVWTPAMLDKYQTYMEKASNMPFGLPA